MLRHNRQQRLNEGGERLSKVLTDLAKHIKGASLSQESISVHRDSLLTKTLNLYLHGQVVIGRCGHVNGLHLEVNRQLGISHELVKQLGHELGELLAKETSALGKCLLDSFVLGIVVCETSLDSRGEVLGDLNNGGLEWLLVFVVSDRANDGAKGLDGAGAQFLSLHGVGGDTCKEVHHDRDESAKVLLEIFLDDI